MDEAERLLRDLREGHTCLMNVPLGDDLVMAENEVREFGRDHDMELSIVQMTTDTDQKLAIWSGTGTAGPSYK